MAADPGASMVVRVVDLLLDHPRATLIAWLAVVIVLLMHVVLRHMRWGLHTTAAGAPTMHIL